MTPEFNALMFGERMKRARQAKKLTIIALAKLADVNKNTVLNVEKGKHKTAVETVFKMCNALKVNPMELLSDKPVEGIDYVVIRRHDETGGKRDIGDILASEAKGITPQLPGGRLCMSVAEVFPDSKNKQHPNGGETLIFGLSAETTINFNNKTVDLLSGDSAILTGFLNPEYEGNGDESSVVLRVINADMKTLRRKKPVTEAPAESDSLS